MSSVKWAASALKILCGLVLCGTLLWLLYETRSDAQTIRENRRLDQIEQIIRSMNADYDNEPWRESVRIHRQIFFPLKTEQSITHLEGPEPQEEPFRFVSGFIFPMLIDDQCYWFWTDIAGRVKRIRYVEADSYFVDRADLGPKASARFIKMRQELMMKVSDYGI